MTVPFDEVQRMYVKIANGVRKEDYPYPLSAEASKLWDKIEAQVKEILDRGDGLEVEGIEWPEVEIPSPVSK
jgi:hypothetical protein